MSRISFAIVVGVLAGTATAQTAPLNSTFQTLDHHRGNLVRFDPGVDWSSYGQIRLVAAASGSTGECPGVAGRDAVKLQSVLDKSLKAAFGRVAAGSGSVLEIRPNITSVRKTSTVTNVIGLALVQMPLSYGSASVDFELIDATSGRMVGEITSQRDGRPWNLPPWDALESLHALGQSEVLLKSDAKRLRKDMQRLAKYSATHTPNLAAASAGAQLALTAEAGR